MISIPTALIPTTLEPEEEVLTSGMMILIALSRYASDIALEGGNVGSRSKGIDEDDIGGKSCLGAESLLYEFSALFFFDNCPRHFPFSLYICRHHLTSVIP